MSLMSSGFKCDETKLDMILKYMVGCSYDHGYSKLRIFNEI